MNKSFRKTGAMIMALFLTFVMLAACSTSNNGGNAGGSSTPPASGTAAGEKPAVKSPEPPKEKEITIYAINGDPLESFNARFGDAIRAKFPHYKLNYIQNGKGNTLEDLVATGRKYDITYHAIGFYESFVMPLGLEYDMTELIKKHDVDLNRFESTSIDAIKQISNGKMYSLPVYGNNLILYYNKTIFDKFGVPYPKDGMTWKQVMDLAKTLTRQDAGVQYYGLAMHPTFITRMNPLSIPNADLAANTPTINKDDRWKRFYQSFFADWKTALGTVPKTPDQVMFLTEKNVAMSAYLSSVITISPEYKDFDWDMVSLPSFEDMPGTGSQINSINFGIASNSDNKDDAMQILKYMTSDEFQTRLSKMGIMPVLKSDAVRKVLGQDSPFKGKNFQSIFYNKPAMIPPKALYDANMVSTYAKHGTQVFQGTVDINTALRNADEEAKKIITDYLNSKKK